VKHLNALKRLALPTLLPLFLLMLLMLLLLLMGQGQGHVVV
jgi:hypothetical protein